MTADQFALIIDRIYQAAEDANAWTHVLEPLCDVLRAPTGVIHIQYTGSPQSSQVNVAIGVDLTMQRAYEEHYARTNIWTTRGLDRLVQGATLTGQMICSDAEVERSEYYNDYLRKLDLFHSIATIPLQQQSGALILSALRPRRSGAFTAEDVGVLQSLSPHLHRAVRLSQKWTEATAFGGALASAIEHVAIGVVLLDDTGAVLHANTMGRALLSECGWDARADAVEPHHATRSTTLRNAIQQAVAGEPRVGALLRLARGTGSPVEISIMPLTATRGDAHVQAVLFVADPDLGLTSSARLRALYGMTPMEAYVATELAAGRSVKELADERRTSTENVRWAVRQILRKTGSRNQAQAVAKILKGLATLTSSK